MEKKIKIEIIGSEFLEKQKIERSRSFKFSRDKNKIEYEFLGGKNGFEY